MKHIFKKALILILLLTATQTSFSQKEKLTLAEKIPGWYRFEKGRHGFSFFAGLDGYEARDENRQVYSYCYSTNVRLGYSYIPFNSTIVYIDGIYGYSFNHPHYNHEFFRSILGFSKTFFGKNKFFMGTGVEFVMNNYRYRIHPDVPSIRYFDDTVYHKLNSHYLYYLNPNVFFGYCFGNNTTLQSGIGYNIYLGDKAISPFSFDIKFTYYFPLRNR